MGLSTQSLKNIKNYGSLNHESSDLSDMVFVPVAHKKYNYFCNSNKCTGFTYNATRILKFEAVKLRYDTDCPDCGSTMFCKKAKTLEHTDT